MLFEKNKEFLVCVDSDGTVMDTMTIKHKNCFGPAFVEIFSVDEEIREKVLAEWNRINLYSIQRGINRFQGLDEILQYCREYGYNFPGVEGYHLWVQQTDEFSLRSLKKAYWKDPNNQAMKLAIVWSDEVNARIEKLPIGKPFDGVVDILKETSKQVDLVGVSSANESAVFAEWDQAGLGEYFRFVGCQSAGKKEAIIMRALSSGYQKENALMLGDSKGDIDAAEKNHIHFFPIIPKHEVESWKEFKAKGLPRLLSDRFDEEYQKSLYEKFYQSLK